MPRAKVELAVTLPGTTVVKDSTVTHQGRIWIFRTVFAPGDVGVWKATATATAADGITQAKTSAPLLVGHATRIVGFDVRPRVVVKGHDVTVSGRVQARIDGRWRDLAGKAVVIFFKPAVPGDLPLQVITDGHGRFSAQETQNRSGWYTAFTDYDGQTGEGILSRMVFVKVIKSGHAHF
ncbi:hypothetical protein J5X84_17300 [Streptosporangiaceae bacterium NEAU-GS5]|nr:hypothetical protein [Streptosporangiaceae bacterium NEAU-GS5]